MLGTNSIAEAVRFRSAPDSGSESGSWCKSDIYNCIFKFVECIRTRNKYILVNLFSLDIDKEKKDIVRSSTGGLRLQFFQFFYISWVSEQLEQLLNFASTGIGIGSDQLQLVNSRSVLTCIL